MYYILLVLIAVTGLFYYDTFNWLIESWINNEYYSHGFIVPVVSGYLIWNMRRELIDIEKKQSHAGLIILAGGIIFQSIGVLWTIRFLSGISLLFTIWGAVLYLFGWKLVKKISFPLLFLSLMVPLPLVDIVAPPIQAASAISAQGMASLLGIPVQRDGLILKTPSGSFEVGLPCSGLSSMISLLTVGIIFAFILEGTRLMKFTIIISSIPLALAGNIVRITSVLLVASFYGQDVAIDYFHDFSSLLLFSVALLGLFLTGRCFGRLKFKKTF